MPSARLAPGSAPAAISAAPPESANEYRNCAPRAGPLLAPAHSAQLRRGQSHQNEIVAYFLGASGADCQRMIARVRGIAMAFDSDHNLGVTAKPHRLRLKHRSRRRSQLAAIASEINGRPA